MSFIGDVKLIFLPQLIIVFKLVLNAVHRNSFSPKNESHKLSFLPSKYLFFLKENVLLRDSQGKPFKLAPSGVTLRSPNGLFSPKYVSQFCVIHKRKKFAKELIEKMKNGSTFSKTRNFRIRIQSRYFSET